MRERGKEHKRAKGGPMDIGLIKNALDQDNPTELLTSFQKPLTNGHSHAGDVQ